MARNERTVIVRNSSREGEMEQGKSTKSISVNQKGSDEKWEK